MEECCYLSIAFLLRIFHLWKIPLPRFRFPNLGIQHVTKKKVVQILTERILEFRNVHKTVQTRNFNQCQSLITGDCCKTFFPQSSANNHGHSEDFLENLTNSQFFLLNFTWKVIFTRNPDLYHFFLIAQMKTNWRQRSRRQIRRRTSSWTWCASCSRDIWWTETEASRAW